MAKTLAEQLENVEAAIDRLESKPQSITEDGQSYVNPALRDLYNERRELKKEIALQGPIEKRAAEI